MVDHGPPSSTFNYQPFPAEYQRNHPPPGFQNNGGPGPSRHNPFPSFPPPPPNDYRPSFPLGGPPPPTSNLGRNKYPQAPPFPPPPPSHMNNSSFNFPPPPPPPRHNTFGPQARMGDGGVPPPQKRVEKKQAAVGQNNKPIDDPPVLRVANVPDNTTVEDIRLLFQRFGGIVKIQMWKSTRLKNTNAYVTLKDHAQLNKVLAQFDRNVKLKAGIWTRFVEKGYKCSLNVPTGNEWFKYEAPTTIEWSKPSLPTDGPSRDAPSSPSSSGDATLPLEYADDSKPLPSSSSSTLLLLPIDDEVGPVDGSIRAHRRPPVETGEPEPQVVEKEEGAPKARRSRSRKRRGSWNDEASLPPAARVRGDEPSSRSRSPSRHRSDADITGGGGGGDGVGAAGSSSSASVVGGDGPSAVAGPSTTIAKEAPRSRGGDSWVAPPSPPNDSSNFRGRNGRSLSPAMSDRGGRGRVVSGKGSWNGAGGIPPSSSTRQQPPSNHSSPPTPAGGPSNYERTPAPSSSGGLVSPPHRHGHHGRQHHQQHQRNPSNQSLPRLGPTTSASSSSSSLLSNPSTAPYPHPPPPFIPAPNTDSDLVQRLHELESLLTASRDQSSQIYHHLITTESSLLTLANTLLTAQQSQKKVERERDEALSWRNEVERRMGTVLGVLEEIGGRNLREGVERGLEEGRRGEREVEGELKALMDVDEEEGPRGGRIDWDVVEGLVKRGREQELDQERERGRRR